MKNVYPSPELEATSHNAQLILDEIDRIINDGQDAVTDSSKEKNSQKKYYYNGVSLVRFPEGKTDVDDATSTDLAIVAFKDEETLSSYTVYATSEYGLKLKRRTFQMPSKIYFTEDPKRETVNSSEQVNNDSQFATDLEALTLIQILKEIDRV